MDAIFGGLIPNEAAAARYFINLPASLFRPLNVKKILIADDNPIDRALIEGILKNQTKWQIESVESGSAAVARVKSSIEAGDASGQMRPSVLVTDLLMPGLDGLELISQIKKIDPTLPILLITNSDNQEIAMSALRAGATSFSPKQSLATDLVTTINQVLEVAQRMKYTHSASFCAVPDHHAFVLENESSLIGADDRESTEQAAKLER